ncbi:hypothetical protein [Rubrivivax sp. JA1026]|uniref:hypothetical protein n=1 Tax=Rubrivivax sp. JA1026 TaxID=2710888 RepID=UPI0013E9870D|nr:hypothetical protein [Rubrivivax sp. JA1026]
MATTLFRGAPARRSLTPAEQEIKRLQQQMGYDPIAAHNAWLAQQTNEARLTRLRVGSQNAKARQALVTSKSLDLRGLLAEAKALGVPLSMSEAECLVFPARRASLSFANRSALDARESALRIARERRRAAGLGVTLHHDLAHAMTRNSQR